MDRVVGCFVEVEVFFIGDIRDAYGIGLTGNVGNKLEPFFCLAKGSGNALACAILEETEVLEVVLNLDNVGFELFKIRQL